jgi:hypothetical protein
MHLILDIRTNLLIPVAIDGDGPPLPRVRLRNCNQQMGAIRMRRIEAKRLRGAN